MAETKSRGSTQSCFDRYFSWFNRHVPRQNISLLTTPTAGQKASIAVDQQLGAEVTRKNLSIQPTLKIPVGYRFNDILFEAPYTSKCRGNAGTLPIAVPQLRIAHKRDCDDAFSLA
jgi:type IV secretory pathway VirB10-like protein